MRIFFFFRFPSLFVRLLALWYFSEHIDLEEKRDVTHDAHFVSALS